MEGHTLSHPFICEADVGHPAGNVSVFVKRPGDDEFRLADFNFTSEREDVNCSTHIRRYFKFRPRLDHNGLQIRCVVTNDATLPPGYNLVASSTVHVVPGRVFVFVQNNCFQVCLKYIQRDTPSPGIYDIEKCNENLANAEGNRTHTLPDCLKNVLITSLRR